MVFAPLTRPRLAISRDGARAAIHEASQVTIVDLPGGGVVAELGIDPAATDSDVGWVGVPQRLLVLTRFAAHTTIQLVELGASGARTRAEIHVEAAMRLHATVANFGLAIGPVGVAVLATTETHITTSQFPSRTLPLSVGAAGGQFVVALPGVIEEWDPASRRPKRRVRLPRPVKITAIGGSERVLWMTTQVEPQRIDVIALVNRGQPKAWDLPESIGSIAGHPSSDLVACVGAESGKVYLVDLDGRTPMRMLRLDPLDHPDALGLAGARMTSVIGVQTGRVPVAVSIHGASHKPEASVAVPATIAVAEAASGDPPDPPRPSSLMPEPAPTRFDRPTPVTVVPQAPPVIMTAPRPSQSAWRDELVVWARSITPDAVVAPPPGTPLIDAVVDRLELSDHLRPAVVFMYALHLLGESGAPPVALAQVLGQRWDGVLGGELVTRGIVEHVGARARLATPILRVLDELPPSGVMLGEPGDVALLGPCVVIATDAQLGTVAERYLGRVGSAILIGERVAARHIVLEARARGAVPIVRAADLDRIPSEPAILVVATAGAAAQIDLPLL